MDGEEPSMEKKSVMKDRSEKTLSFSQSSMPFIFLHAKTRYVCESYRVLL